jgi:hypothetical protein
VCREEGASAVVTSEHPRRRHPRFSEPTEGRPEGETEKVGGAQQGG